MSDSSIDDKIFYQIVANILNQKFMAENTEYNFQIPIDTDYFLENFFNVKIINKECFVGTSKIEFKLVPLNVVYRIEPEGNKFIVHKKHDNSIFDDEKIYYFDKRPLLSNETIKDRILKDDYFDKERETFGGYTIPDFFVLKEIKEHSYISYIYNNHNSLDNNKIAKWKNFYKKELDGSNNTIFNQQVTFPFNQINENYKIEKISEELDPYFVINNLYIDVNNLTFYENLTPLGKEKLVNDYNDYLKDIRRKNPSTGGKARKTRSKKSRKIRVKKYRKSKQVRIKKFKKTNKNKKITKRFRKTNKSRKVRR
jgi:hypothetical protein